MAFWSGFAEKKSGFTVKKMRCGTVVKTRVVRAFDASTLDPFEFNRSINPRGGSLAKIKIRTNKKMEKYYKHLSRFKFQQQSLA
jgi:hypothetical protein